jgi:hypothetical protein
MVSRMQQTQCVLQKIRDIEKKMDKVKDIREKEILKIFKMDFQHTLKILSES